MTKKQYEMFAAKPENGGIDADTASAQWSKLQETPGNITDVLGPSPEQANRVAVKVADKVSVCPP